ncbi:MAG: hypothetical protein ACYCX4_08080 [Bacillota bacterium]
MEVFFSTWVITIGRGILSGLIVTLITRMIFFKQNNREYYQKLFSANREVIYALRILISEGAFPEKSLVESLINSNARKYAVEVKDLNNVCQITEDLIKEIMDSIFIPGNLKIEICSKLSALRNISIMDVEPIKTIPIERLNYRSEMITMTSIIVGVNAALMTVLQQFVGLQLDIVKLIIPTIAALLATLAIAFMSLLNRQLNKKKRNDNEYSKKPSHSSNDDKM